MLLRGNSSIAEGNRQILMEMEALQQRILELEKNILSRLDGGASLS